MATVAKLVEAYTAPGRIVTKWAAALGNADDGVPMRLSNVASLQVEVTGTGGGATLIIEGSSDGVLWSTLHDADGTDLSFAAATIPRIENVRECTMPYIRPRTTGGSGTAMVPTFIAQQNMV